MKISESILMELQEEAKSTRKILERVPSESFGWKPHDKSMTLGRLASHVAEIPGWVFHTLDTDVMDFAKFDYKPPVLNTTEDLLIILDSSLEKSIDSLNKASDEDYFTNWTMRNGETVYFTLPKIVVIRTFALNHNYHHRGQLTVYLRMLNVPLPNIYGPTADEPMM